MSSSNQLRTLWYGIFIVLISDANLYDMVVIFFLNFADRSEERRVGKECLL